MGVSLVYLGKNDEPPGDKGEMYKMCKAIEAKLEANRIPFQQTNLGEKSLPAVNTVTEKEVWFCGHSRFVEANQSIRGFEARNLGGFPMAEIANFIKSCVGQGKFRFRLICCESAQQQRRIPESANPPKELSGVLGNEYLETATDSILDDLRTYVHANQSHLEGLILAMAQLWGDEKNASQPQFEIYGLWGAGDITDKKGEKVTSFLQNEGSLEALAKMNNPKTWEKDRERATATFKNAHCENHQLPDFFGYHIPYNLLVNWVRQEREICLVVFKCNINPANVRAVQLPDGAKVIPQVFWANYKVNAEKPNCPVHGNAACMEDKEVVNRVALDGAVELAKGVKLEVRLRYDSRKIRNI